jgi:outer membrane receptor for ferrienterochelin and colicins
VPGHAELRAALLLALCAPLPLAGQSAVSGRVVHEGAPIVGARVRVGDLPPVVVGRDGTFRIRRAVGAHEVRVTAIGYAPRRIAIVLPADSLLGDVALEPIAAPVSDLVVTGTLAEVRLADSPVKVELISRAALQRNLTTNLMESVRTLPGLREQVDCGVCYTNSISINGMDGPYTAVLFDGVPILGALATTYALNSLNPALLERVEIVKGPASTLYGSEAMGGVVNVITRDPRTAPAWSVTSNASSHGEMAIDLMARPLLGGGRLLVAASGAHNTRFVDANGDNFTDLPLLTRLSGLVKWSDGSVSDRRADVLARWWHEDRFGGVRGWQRRDRGSDQIYGESIRTVRMEVVGGFRPRLLGDAIRVDAAVARHRQDSWYGARPYAALQTTLFGQVAWAPTTTGLVRPLLGVTVRHNRYDDDTPATATVDRRTILGVFAEGEWKVGAGSILAGTRLDRHADHGLIASPRLALRWAQGDALTARVNLATGFRVVNLFTEDHAALTGARQVVLAESLDPERSITAAASLQWRTGMGTLPITIDVDAFRTRFSNRIVPDYDSDPRAIIYRNLRGHALTQGGSVAIGVEPGEGKWSGRLSGTVQQVTLVEGGVSREQPFAPRFKGEFAVSWDDEGVGSLNWTGSVLGPMRLPTIAGRDTHSPWFSEQQVQLTRPMADNTFLTVGVKNLFDSRQRDPLVAPEDPFGPDFDTAQVWGPTQGRRLFVALQWNAPR